jgi:hypothetical protein
MGMRAVITITEQIGSGRSFWAAWASPEYQIPHLADFLIWADQHHHRLTVQTWLAYADAFPGTLPREEVTGTVLAADTYIGDLDYRYHLSLHEDSGGVRVQVRQLRGVHRESSPRLVAELTRANLFVEAARLCDLVAGRMQQNTEGTAGNSIPGGDPDGWRRRAAQFRDVHASTPVTALTANLAGRLRPATFDVPHPSIQVAGVWVFAYVDRHGTVRISAHLDEAEPWLLRPDDTVPMRVTVEDTVLFEG